MKIAKFIQEKANKYGVAVIVENGLLGHIPRGNTVYRLSGFNSEIEAFRRDPDVVRRGYEEIPGARGNFIKNKHE